MRRHQRNLRLSKLRRSRVSIKRSPTKKMKCKIKKLRRASILSANAFHDVAPENFNNYEPGSSYVLPSIPNPSHADVDVSGLHDFSHCQSNFPADSNALPSGVYHTNQDTLDVSNGLSSSKAPTDGTNRRAPKRKSKLKHLKTKRMATPVISLLDSDGETPGSSCSGVGDCDSAIIVSDSSSDDDDSSNCRTENIGQGDKLPDIIFLPKDPVKANRKRFRQKRFNREKSNEVVEVTMELGPLRDIVIDGCNVAFSHGKRTKFSCEGISIVNNYFKQRGHRVFAFIPQFRRCHFQTTNLPLLDQLEAEGVLHYTPSRRVNGKLICSYDDRFIVEFAAQKGAVIVSRDNYRDLSDDPNVPPDWKETIAKRLLMYTFVDDLVMFPNDPLGRGGPDLDHFLRFPPSAEVKQLVTVSSIDCNQSQEECMLLEESNDPACAFNDSPAVESSDSPVVESSDSPAENLAQDQSPLSTCQKDDQNSVNGNLSDHLTEDSFIVVPEESFEIINLEKSDVHLSTNQYNEEISFDSTTASAGATCTQELKVKSNSHDSESVIVID